MLRRLLLVLGALLICFNATTVLGQVTFVPPDLMVGDTYHVAFVTDGVCDATSSAIGDYNSFVQMEAERTGASTENWGVSWFAIGSTTSVNARDNIPVTTSPVYLLGSSRLAINAADLWDGNIGAAFNITQFGGPNFSQDVFTGSLSNGTFSPGIALGESIIAGTGISFTTSSSWAFNGAKNSGTRLPLYAVSSELTVIPEPATFGTCMLLSGLGVLGGFGRRMRERR